MKKTLVFVSALALSSSVFAATAFQDGGTTGSSTPVDTGACPSLNEAVSVKLSKNNVGAYDCTGGVNIGVAVASTVGKAATNGKGTAYGASSSGGAIQEIPCAAAACVSSDTTTAATTALGS